MQTASTFTIKPISSAIQIANRYKRSGDQPPPAPEPSYKDDLIERINAEQNVYLDDGPRTIIDVQPDYRFPLSAIITHVIRIYATLDQRNNPIITPASLTAYCLAILYAYALITDTENVRTSKSHWSDDFNDNSNRRDYLIELERCFVPSFMNNILTGLVPTRDPRRPNVLFTNTLAGYSINHDYGRSFPITMFLHAHHLVATNPANTPPSQIYDDWINHTVLIAANQDFKIGNLIGTGLQNGEYENWLLSRIKSLFNPVTSRSNTNRPTFSPIVTFPYEPTDEVNPYIYLLGADSNNIFNALSFLQGMSNVIHEQLTGSNQLGSYFGITSGTQILTHMYHGPALPTWHWITVSPIKDRKDRKDLTATGFARTIRFLSDETIPSTPPTTIKYPESDADIDKTYYLVRKPNGTLDTDQEDSTILFDIDEHVLPDVRYFDPWEYNPSKLPYTMMTGILIESAEIDGFSVPQPNLNVPLSTENSYLLNSAVPLHWIKTAKQIGNQTDTILYQRSFVRQQSTPVGISLYDLSTNRLPYFNTSVNDPSPPRGFYGFNKTTDISWFIRAFSYFGFKIRSQNTSTQDPNLPKHHLYAWSSYRYVNSNVPRSTPATHRVSMLCNFRTIYGTNVTLSQSVHPSRLIPTA